MSFFMRILIMNSTADYTVNHSMFEDKYPLLHVSLLPGFRHELSFSFSGHDQ